MKHYFFGCLGGVGHYLYGPGGVDRGLPDMGQTPWGHELDGGLAPPSDESKTSRGEGYQKQGHTAIHHKGGWTLISWWDRTVDTRYACNSGFMVEGEFDFGRMVELLKELWPQVHERQPVELFL